MSHMRVTTSRSESSFLALGQLPEDRAQAEIDVALHVEALGRQRERVERGEHAGLGLGVEREDAPLLDQRARHRLVERPLRQLQFERLALALVAGFVAGDERHRPLAPAHGCSVRSLVVWPTPLRVRACGSASGKSGASKSERGGIAVGAARP